MLLSEEWHRNRSESGEVSELRMQSEDVVAYGKAYTSCQSEATPDDLEAAVIVRWVVVVVVVVVWWWYYGAIRLRKGPSIR